MSSARVETRLLFLMSRVRNSAGIPTPAAGKRTAAGTLNVPPVGSDPGVGVEVGASVGVEVGMIVGVALSVTVTVGVDVTVGAAVGVGVALVVAVGVCVATMV
jgi:hypothetical protein